MLVINPPAWYLLGHGLSRNASRTFRLDHVRAARVLEATFLARPRDMISDLAAAGVSPERV